MSNNVYVINGTNKTAEQVQKEIESVLRNTVHNIETQTEDGDTYSFNYVGNINTIELQNVTQELFVSVSDEIFVSYDYFDHVSGHAKMLAGAYGYFFELKEKDKPETWETMRWVVRVQEDCEELGDVF